ncbi:MAG: hypothetical protein D8H97_41960 [Neisseria sp.]|nr:MAG: hypothetical protein D8H97_41960 [Neisseria sp.]
MQKHFSDGLFAATADLSLPFLLQRLGMAAFGCGTVNLNKNAPYRHSRAGGNPGIGFVGIRLAQTQIFGLLSYWE